MAALQGRIVLVEIFILKVEPFEQVEIHHLGTIPLIYQHCLYYVTVYSGYNHQGIIMWLNRALQIIIIKGNGLPSVLQFLLGRLITLLPSADTTTSTPSSWIPESPLGQRG